MPVTLAPRKLREEGHEFEVSLGYIASQPELNNKVLSHPPPPTHTNAKINTEVEIFVLLIAFPLLHCDGGVVQP